MASLAASQCVSNKQTLALPGPCPSLVLGDTHLMATASQLGH